MVDPITGAAVGGAANAVGRTVIEAIVRGEDDHEEWLQQVVDVAAETESGARYYGESIIASEREILEDLLEQQGRQAQKLEVIGERQGYDSEEVEAVKRLAEICGAIGKTNARETVEFDQIVNEELPDCVEHIFDLANSQ